MTVALPTPQAWFWVGFVLVVLFWVGSHTEDKRKRGISAGHSSSAQATKGRKRIEKEKRDGKMQQKTSEKMEARAASWRCLLYLNPWSTATPLL
jgi:uncharacterized membrane protein